MRTRQSGFTLVELMIALLIGLFLMGGLMTLVQDNKRTFTSQGELAQLQDAERLAMIMLTDVIQQSGYFPDPTLNTATKTFPATNYAYTGPSNTTYTYPMALGQAISGTGAGTGDSILVRYATAGGDGILNCTGGANGTQLLFVNAFSVALNPITGISQLVCTQNGTAYPLVDNVVDMAVLYGVSTTGGANVDTYMNASQVTAAVKWNSVVSVKITLTFKNPLYSATNVGQGLQPATYQIQRNIGIMNQGV